MCEKHNEDYEGSIDDKDNTVDNKDDEVEDDDSGMNKEELERKVREHMERRKDAYVKMGSVDSPR